MDMLKNFADTIVDGLVPQFKTELEYAYVVSMVLLAVNSAERSWHKENVFTSFFRALLSVNGANLVMAICLGESPVAQLADMNTITTVLLVWWVALFAPLDVLNKALSFKVGDIAPVALLLVVMTSLRNLVAAGAAVDASLAKFPGSLIAVLLGTVGGGGTYAVAGVFGDFARQISSESVTKNAFLASLLLTVCKVFFPTCVCVNVVLMVLILLVVTLNVAASLNKDIDIVTAPYDILKQLVNLRDLLQKKKTE